MARVQRRGAGPWLAKFISAEEPQLPPKLNTEEARTTYREVMRWDERAHTPMVVSPQHGRLVHAHLVEGYAGLSRWPGREGEDWEIQERQTMPGMCAVCVIAVLNSGSVVFGSGENEHELSGPMLKDALHDWVSGEWGLRQISLRTDDGQVLRMSAITTIQGTAVCAEHAREWSTKPR